MNIYETNRKIQEISLWNKVFSELNELKIDIISTKWNKRNNINKIINNNILLYVFILQLILNYIF